MKFSRVSALVASLVMVLGATVHAADNYKLDPVHSFVIFKIRHMEAGTSFGRFNNPEGSFTVDADPTKETIDITVKVDNLDTNNEARDKHLKSPDFFNAKQFPEITFKSKSVKGLDGGSIEVTGDLTLHGVTKSITVKLEKIGEAEHPQAGHRLGYETSLVIKRSEYGMDKMIPGASDDVTLMIAFEGVRQ